MCLVKFPEKMVLRQKQKLVGGIIDLLFRFCIVGERGVETISGNVMSAEACLRLTEHQLYVLTRKAPPFS